VERGSVEVSYPSDLEIVVTRQFHAPQQLVFDVFTRPELARRTIAPFGEEVKVCAIDLRVGGDYHYVFTPEGGPDCDFSGTYLEVDAPRRTSQTWRFGGWPGVEAVESIDLSEAAGITTLVSTMAFQDRAGRDRMHTVDGLLANLDHIEDLLRDLT